MACDRCNGETHDWFGDSFCDSCGGVTVGKKLLIFRHVCTVDGKGGRLPIVWDESSSDYKFRYPVPFTPTKKLMSLEPDFNRYGPRYATVHGTLDAVLALALPHAKGEGNEVELSASPSSTDEERRLLKVV